MTQYFCHASVTTGSDPLENDNKTFTTL